MINRERLEYLFKRYLDRKETPAERQELMELVEDLELKEQVHQLLDNARLRLSGTAQMSEEQTEKVFASVVKAAEGFEVIRMQSRSRSRRFWWRASAAASILLLVIVGAYYLLNSHSSDKEALVQQSGPADIPAPVTNRAMVTLANGEQIFLDRARNGTLVSMGNVQLVKLGDGQIAYKGTAAETSYNTLTNPRGSKVIDITLADGSRVWLNSGSSITYPVAFTGRERKVTITGEAYFEVAHNAEMPFKVEQNDMLVTVLGTRFNVNGYDNLKDIRITLLQGSVKVSNGDWNDVLTPGQQAQVSEMVKVVNDVDIESVMAWKNGFFKFNAMDLQGVIGQLHRWYDVDIEYKGKIPDKQVTGYISREVNISKVLEMLEYTAGLKYQITGKKIKLE